MCSRTTCQTCGKPTWAGCGAHIEQALAGVAVADRCRCREAPVAKAGSQAKADGRRSG